MSRQCCLMIAILAGWPLAACPAAEARRPNVILFLVDDMGWMDSTPYGSQYYDTPNIERLAAQGMRFTRAYAQPLCSPTRACLLTGLNAVRHGITSAVGHTPPAECTLPESGPPNQAFVYPTSKTFLDPAEYTLAEALRDAGYRTGHFGKWHLGLTQPHWPEAQGFDVAFHCHPDAGPPNAYFSPYGVVPAGNAPPKGKKRLVGTITDGPPGEYITDRLTDEAIRFVEESKDRPFFLNLWHYGVHGPWGHKESLTAEMAKRTDPTGRQDNPVMASMLKSVDESLGRLLDTLDRLGIADDTLLVFMSDNGGNTHSDPRPTNNAPLRDGKGRLYEGGVRVPLIVRFPGRVQPGTTSDALVGCIDVYPTVLDLIGVERHPAQVIDGISYAGVLRGTATAARDSYVIWFPGRPHGANAYAGDWKLIRREEPSPEEPGVTRELYNLRDDIGEAKNLAGQMPEKVKELEAIIDGVLEETHAVVPKPNPAHRAKPRKPAAAAEPRPNVLWIYLEDVSGWFSCYGERLIETPNIDRLAARGTRFTRFYTSAGVCSATRSAVMLGAMQTTHGVHHHRSSRNNAQGTKHDGIGMIHLPEGVVPLPQWCRQHGVWTFNEGGKDDFNFVFSHDDFYDFCPRGPGWGPPLTVAGDCWRGRKAGQPFFGQVQLAGGKFGLGPKGVPPKRVVDRAAVPVPPYYPDIPEIREEIARHYDCLLETDAQVGEIMAALDRDGLADSTVVILFSDHGYGLHRHKQFLYEGGIHMPLIVAGPGIPAGAVRDDLASSIDIAPTTLGILGLPAQKHFEGRDLFAADRAPREFVVAARDRCDYTIEKIRAIVTKKYKYLRNYLTDRPYMQPSYKDPWPVSIRLREMMKNGEMNEVQNIFFGDKKPAEELYDLDNDPHEIQNLAADPAHAAELARHRKLLADWIAATGDKGQTPEDDAGLIQVLYEWGEKCVNPEYEHLRGVIEPKPTAPAKKPRAAALELGTPFRDHMVLQREKPVPVWGWAEAGDDVAVEFAGQRKAAKAGADGKWMVRLDPLAANALPATLTVTSARSGGPLAVSDVLVGEVWLGSGQSNMKMMVQSAANFAAEKQTADLPLLRMFIETSDATREPQARGAGGWHVSSPDTVGTFSATLYFFGRELHRALGVPVGLVNSSWGGTPIQSWTDEAAQRKVAELAPFVAMLDRQTAAFDREAERAKYEHARAAWPEKERAARAAGKPAPHPPVNTLERHDRNSMGRLFNGKIAPLIPFAIRGAVWYQGEGNGGVGIGGYYRHQLPLLVTDWRARWGDEFSFAWVQLPNYAPASDGWMLVREAMLESLRLPQTGMAIAIDIGDPQDIHPKNKQDVGRRLAAWALADVYGRPVPARSGPLPAGSDVRGTEIVCRFTDAEGLRDRDGGEIDGFLIAGPDRQWRPARARIDGTSVAVSAANVSSPAAVRYGWAANPKCDLVNAAGLPASPFRTDTWPIEAPAATKR